MKFIGFTVYVNHAFVCFTTKLSSSYIIKIIIIQPENFILFHLNAFVYLSSASKLLAVGLITTLHTLNRMMGFWHVLCIATIYLTISVNISLAVLKAKLAVKDQKV